MIKLKDLFKPKHAEDAEKRAKAQDEALAIRADLQKIGQACMSDPKFAKYKEAFAAMERLTFDQVRYYKNPDPIQYAMVVSNMLVELNAFEALIGDVESDAKKKVMVPNVK